jgi:hypothetical protein
MKLGDVCSSGLPGRSVGTLYISLDCTGVAYDADTSINLNQGGTFYCKKASGYTQIGYFRCNSNENIKFIDINSMRPGGTYTIECVPKSASTAYMEQGFDYTHEGCNNGLFIALNKEGGPLKSPFVLESFGPGSSLELDFKEDGVISITRICFDPLDVHKEETYVLSKGTIYCDKNCRAGEECKCEIKECSGGLLLLLNKEGSPIDLTSTAFIEPIGSSEHIKTFTPASEGVGYAMAICFNRQDVVHRWYFSVSE